MARLLQVAVALSLATWSVAARAQTSMINPSSGKCRYIVPNGSTIYAQSGEVYLKDAYIGNYLTNSMRPRASQASRRQLRRPYLRSPMAVAASTRRIAVRGAPALVPVAVVSLTLAPTLAVANDSELICQRNANFPDAGGCCRNQVGGGCDNVGGKGSCLDFWCTTAPPYHCVNNVGWAAGVGADAGTHAGLLPSSTASPQIGLFREAPTNPGDAVQAAWWNGLGNAWVQPELWYYGKSNLWQITAQFNGGCTPSDGWFCSGTGYGILVNAENVTVSQGDEIEGYAQLLEDNAHTGGQGNLWEVYAFDLTPVPILGSGFFVYTPAPLPTGADLAVLEVQGLAACDGLPVAESEGFNTWYLSQAGTGDGGLEQENNVLPYVVPVPWWLGSGASPPCEYGASVSPYEGGYLATLSWNAFLQPAFESPTLWSNLLVEPGGGTVILGDVNGDGMADVVEFDIGSTWVMLAEGNNQFGTRTQVSGYFWGISGVAVGDVDGDGLADAVAFNDIAVNGSSVTVMLGQKNGTFGYPTPWPSQAFGGQVATLLADVNGDTRADAVAFTGSSTWVMLANDNHTFGASTLWSSRPFKGNVATLLAA